MFDIGFAELLVLAVIAMVVIGPEKLPSVARTVGKTLGKARRMMTNLQNQIEQEVKLDELNKKIMEETKEMDFTKQTIHPSHKNEDAEVPAKAPTVKEDTPKTTSAAAEKADSSDQVNTEDDAKRS